MSQFTMYKNIINRIYKYRSSINIINVILLTRIILNMMGNTTYTDYARLKFVTKHCTKILQ